MNTPAYYTAYDTYHAADSSDKFLQFCWEFLLIDIHFDAGALDEEYISRHVSDCYNKVLTGFFCEEEVKTANIDLRSVSRELFDMYVVNFYNENFAWKVVA